MPDPTPAAPGPTSQEILQLILEWFTISTTDYRRKCPLELLREGPLTVTWYRAMIRALKREGKYVE